MIQFILNNQTIKTSLPPGSTVLDFVRYHKRLVGTKIGCREGDCGACTLLVGNLENGKLVYSSQFRKTNGSTKLDKQTRLVAEKYEVLKNGETENLPISFISTNLLSLYFQEPVGINLVYCDNHESFAKIIKTDDGGYKVKFPDGNSNCFYYSGGVCSKIKISHTFYSAEIILKP